MSLSSTQQPASIVVFASSGHGALFGTNSDGQNKLKLKAKRFALSLTFSITFLSTTSIELYYLQVFF
jgi:hypothetical protein